MLQLLVQKVSQMKKKSYEYHNNNNFSELMHNIEHDLSKQLKKFYRKDSDFIIIDAKTFLHNIKPDIERWLKMEQKKLLTISDVEFLVNDKKEKTLMHASEFINLPVKEIAEIKNRIVKIINNSIRTHLLSKPD